VELDLTRPTNSLAGWTVVAGRNGSGKTTLLRAIALAIAGPSIARNVVDSFDGWISQGADSAVTTVDLIGASDDALLTSDRLRDGPVITALHWSRTNGPEPRLAAGKGTRRAGHGPWAENPKGWMLAAYGPFRHVSDVIGEAQVFSGSTIRSSAIMSLYREDVSLSESVTWLRDVYLRRLEGSQSFAQLEGNVLRLLGDGLLPDDARVTRVTADGLWITQDGVELPLRELSEGYRTAAALVLDIIRRIYAAFGDLRVEHVDGQVQVQNSGVVLIDEVDAHLHVSWQQGIGFWLKRHFPSIQFIVSTHSPFACQAADPAGLIRMPGPGTNLRPDHVPPSTFTQVVNGSVDEAVLSELFGLERSYSPESERLRDQLAKLEVAAIRGTPSQDDIAEISRLRSQLPQTLSSDVAAAVRRLGTK
jgi:energy-coupling factor transporter ATP-binding protein EcfA2